jgi:flagellar hook-associated protein 1 FlgK
MGNSSLLDIGISGLMAQQAKLRAAGHNISNTDTPGFSRQRVETSTQSAHFSGAGFVGSGVAIDGIRRVADEFLVSQLRLDTAVFHGLDSYLTNVSQLDTFLANEVTGLSPGLRNFFGALHGGADDPTSSPARQLVLEEAEGLALRFHTINDRFMQHNDTLNQQMSIMAAEVSSIAEGLGHLNKNITIASARGDGHRPNDLMDDREELLRQLSELVSVKVVNQEMNGVSVFIGAGQALVIGDHANRLVTTPGETDPHRHELAFQSRASSQTVTDSITGGKLGGILDFRTNSLDRALNGLGRIAIALTENINEQHQMGVDLNGEFGSLFFADVNTRANTLSRVSGDNDNSPPNDGVLSVTIEDAGLLTDSDYVFSIPGPGDRQYAITRVNDGAIVVRGMLSGAMPESISLDGFSVHIESGSFSANDRFLVQPTRNGAGEIATAIHRPELIAFASAVVGESSLGNRGSGSIVATEAIDVTAPAFSVPGALSPPLIIRFTSPTTYDVLDNTNPAHPVDLVPPLLHQPFTPGITNDQLPADSAQTSVRSTGVLAGALPGNATVMPSATALTNRYVREEVTITVTDPDTGIVTVQPKLVIAPGEQAGSIASRLSAKTGVAATAFTRVYLSDITDSGSLALDVQINGVSVSDPSLLENPTQTMDTNVLADQINANQALRVLGIHALSDGQTVTITASNGDDLVVTVGGDAGDSVRVRDIKGNQLVMNGQGSNTPATYQGSLNRSNGYDFSQGGPYSFDLSVDGSPPAAITLTGNQISGTNFVQEIQNKIDNSTIGSGQVAVSMNTVGRIIFTTTQTGAGAALDVTNMNFAAAGALGMTAVSTQGTDVMSAAVVGGTIDVVMEEGIVLSSNAASSMGRVFLPEPVAGSTFLGYQVSIDGAPEVGDKFMVEFSTAGVADNRNALSLSGLEIESTIDNSSVSLLESYGMIVALAGAQTAQSRLNKEASEMMMQQSDANRQSISGVNLDEEAADLIRFELAYNASAQVIATARTMFRTLIDTFR